MKLFKTALFVSLISAVVLYAAITETIVYKTAAGAKATTSYSATDTVYSQTIKLGDNEEVILTTNLVGTANAGNYINNDVQGLINGSWVTIATDSAGIGYSSYVLRTDGTITIPTNIIRLQTRRYGASGTITANQEINGF